MNGTALFSGGGGGEYKTKKANLSPKQGAKDIPSWAKGERPFVNESGSQFAKRILDQRYGKGNYSKGPRTEFNQLRKYADRAFKNP